MKASPRGFSGWSTCTSSSCATTFTGGGTVVLRCRPCGRSGCVTTPTTSTPSPNSARSGGVAKSGVPQKRTRMSPLLASVIPVGGDRSRRQHATLARVLLLQVFPARHHPAPLEETEVVDEQLPVQVIDLVLEGACQEIGRLALEQVALEVRRAHRDPCGAVDIPVNVRNRQAAFLGAFLPRFGNDLGVDEDDGIVVDVDDRDTLEASDLWCGEADSLGRAHRVEHVLDKLPQVLGDHADRSCLSAQHWRPQDVDLQQAHAVAPTVPEPATRVMPRRSTTTRDSPDLMVTRSSIDFAFASSPAASLMCTTSPTSPPAVTTLSPLRRLRSRSSCCRRCFCCGRIMRK